MAAWLQSDLLDSLERFLRLHVFWEGKEGKGKMGNKNVRGRRDSVIERDWRMARRMWAKGKTWDCCVTDYVRSHH